MFKRLVGKRWVTVLVVALLLGVLLSQFNIQTVDKTNNTAKYIGVGVGDEKVITIGHIAYAAGSVDYTYNGVNDDVPFQAALNALPATGGRIVDVSAVQKNFSLNVTRAIPNVTITGTGYGSYFVNNGVTALFTAGGNGWKFEDLRTDAGGITMGATTGWVWLRVNNGATAYDLRTPAGSIVNGAFVASSVTDSGLTVGRVPYSGVGGLLSDEAAFAYNSGTNTLSADILSSTTVGATTLNAPTGRGATYVIAASDAPANVKAQADVVVNGTNDRAIINAALATYKTVQLSQGTFYGDGTTITILIDETLVLSPETILEPTNNINVITVNPGGKLYGNGGKIDIDNSSIAATFTKAAIYITGTGGSTDTSFEQKTIVNDVVCLGEVSDGAETDRGKGIQIYINTGEVLEYAEINNNKIRQFKWGIHITNNTTGQFNCNLLSNNIITNSVYMVYLDRVLATTGQMNNNIITFQTEPLAGVSNTIVYNNLTSMNYFWFDAANTTGTLTHDDVIRTLGGSRNTFEYYCEPGKAYYSTDVYSTFKPLEKGFWVEKYTPSIQTDRFMIAVPFRDRDGAVAHDVNGLFIGSQDLELTNSPTWGYNTVTRTPMLTLNGTTQAMNSINNGRLTFDGSYGITLVIAPSFANTDGALHVFWEVYRADEYIQLRKSAAGALECQWLCTGSGGHDVTATGTVAWSANAPLIIQVNKDELNDKLDLYCNGVLVNSAGAATGTTSANSVSIYVGSDHTPSNHTGGNYYFFGVSTPIRNQQDVRNYALQLGNLVGLVLQNSGSATVLNTATSIVVNHGLGAIPSRVQITPRENPTNAVSFWWVDTITATQFTINVNADPGASGLDFDWRAVVGDGN